MIGCMFLLPLMFASTAITLVTGTVTIFFSTLTFVVSVVTGALVMCMGPVLAFLIFIFS